MISVIFPTFNEQENLNALYRCLQDVTEKIVHQKFEFLFVDDGSTDQTPQILKSLNEKDPRVKVIRFTRNCGGHAALSAGLNCCQGDCAIALAADLQDPPELIEQLLTHWQKGWKVVWAERKKREGESIGVRLFSKLYYFLVNQLTEIKMPKLGADVFLIDRVVIEALRQMPEKHTSLYLALSWLSFSQTTIEYIKKARMAGTTKWNLRKKVKLALDSILSFSDVLIRWMSIIGFILAFLGFFYAGSIIFKYIVHGVPVQGWSSLIVAILVIGGIQIMMLGVLGEYLWRTFDESRKRPRFIIEYKIGL